MTHIVDRHRAVHRAPSITDQGAAAGARATGGFRYLDPAEHGRKETRP